MKIKAFMILACSLLMLSLLPIVSFAGTARLNIVHEKPGLKVKSFEYSYGRTAETLNSIGTVLIDAGSQTVDKSTVDVELVGDGFFYFKIKDIYEDNSESEYSNPVKLNAIPNSILKKPEVVIK